MDYVQMSYIVVMSRCHILWLLLLLLKYVKVHNAQMQMLVKVRTRRCVLCYNLLTKPKLALTVFPMQQNGSRVSGEELFPKSSDEMYERDTRHQGTVKLHVNLMFIQLVQRVLIRQSASSRVGESTSWELWRGFSTRRKRWLESLRATLDRWLMPRQAYRRHKQLGFFFLHFFLYTKQDLRKKINSGFQNLRRDENCINDLLISIKKIIFFISKIVKYLLQIPGMKH